MNQSLDTQELEKRWLVWDYVSMSWTEIGLGKDEFAPAIQKIQQHYPNWQDVKPIVNDVQLAFASVIPLMFIFFPIIPDWGYNEDYLLEKIQNWHNLPTWRIWLNPIRWIGYPLAIIMSSGYVRKLKNAY